MANQHTTKTTNNLADLSKLLIIEESTDNTDNPPTLSPIEKKKAYNEFRNSTYTLVSLMAYLIGIDKERFGPENADLFLIKSYEDLEKNKDARIVRNLCRIRAAMERNYTTIANEFKLSYKNIGSIPEFIPSESVMALDNDGVRIYKSKPDIIEYIIIINKELNNRINTVAYLFPEWIKWDYVKPIFLMPNGTNRDGVKTAGDYYNSDRNRYPFQCWINWDAVSIGTASKGNRIIS